MFFNQSEVEFPNWWDDLGAKDEITESETAEISKSGEERISDREQGLGHSSEEENREKVERLEEGSRADYTTRSQRYDQEILSSVWEYAEKVLGNDAALWRKDEFGNWIYRLDYGNRNSEFGWEVFDPGIGRYHQGIYVTRPMQWQSYLKAYDILGA